MQIERAQADTQASSPKRGGLPLLQLKGANQPSFLDRMSYNLRMRDARLKVSLHCTNHPPATLKEASGCSAAAVCGF